LSCMSTLYLTFRLDRLYCCCADFLCLFFFFFSSRRRHTRFSRDWSSDVCSSDLVAVAHQQPLVDLPGLDRRLGARQRLEPVVERSEERRVGKECRSRGSP